LFFAGSSEAEIALRGVFEFGQDYFFLSHVQPRMRIAVVGGGIAGAVVASELAQGLSGSNCSDSDSHNQSKSTGEVVLFDQGRRGPGGRASHRSVRQVEPRKQNTGDGDDGTVEDNDFVVLPDDYIDERAFQFDHGCQFFRTDSPLMKELASIWLREGWVAPWKARFGSLSKDSSSYSDTSSDCDFFGVPSSSSDDGENKDVYVGVGGMHLLPRQILKSSNAVVVHRGTRVSDVVRRDVERGDSSCRQKHVWDLTTTVGVAAFHDTKESVATSEVERASKTESSASPNVSHSDQPSNTTKVIVHRGFDAVVFTDVSSSFESWHRASAGIPPEFASRLPTKLRMPLFSCMIALDTPIKDKLCLDAFVVSTKNNDSPLWFAAASSSKPGFPDEKAGNHECWTLVSTPSFAVDEIQQTTMRDPVTGTFRPQENSYLNSVPGPALKDAFFDLVAPLLGDSPPPLSTVYLQAQRWGSGLPVDPKKVAPEDVKEICGTRYASNVKGSLVYLSPPSEQQQKQPSNNFVADDELGLYYAGDFCSHLNPGFEAAALSGLDLARHILRR